MLSASIFYAFYDNFSSHGVTWGFFGYPTTKTSLEINLLQNIISIIAFKQNDNQEVMSAVDVCNHM